MAKRELNISTCSYNEHADVLFVNFEGDEPTIYEELEDDFILVEVGLTTGLIYGFRVIGLKEHGLTRDDLRDIMDRVMKSQKLFRRKLDISYEKNIYIPESTVENIEQIFQAVG